MRIRIFLLSVMYVTFIATTAQAMTEYDADSIVNVMKRVAKYRMTYADIANLFNHASANKGDQPNIWSKPNLGNDWDVGSFMTGLMALYTTTNDTSYLNFAKRWAIRFAWKPYDGDVYTATADHICCTQTYSEMYMLNPVAANAEMISHTKTNLTNYFTVLKPNPPYSRPNGWYWCDATYMSPPAIAMYCKASGENRFLDSLDRYFWSVNGYLYSTTYHFYYRDDGFFPASQGGKQVFWSCGNAWVVGGLARVLDYLPKTYKSRTKYENLFKDMCAAIRVQQGYNTPYDGLWTTHLLDHTGFPGAESSGSAFFCYAFAWGVRNGLLDSATYVPSINKAWRDLVKNIGSDGRLLRCQHVDWQPRDMAPDVNNSSPEGEGAFLLAGAEMYRRALKATPVKPQRPNNRQHLVSLSVRQSNLIYTASDPEKYLIKIVAANGRLAATLRKSPDSPAAASGSISLRSLGLQPGVYSAILFDPSARISRSFIIMQTP